IRRLSVFGSTLTGAARPEGDVDLLVEFESPSPAWSAWRGAVERRETPVLPDGLWRRGDPGAAGRLTAPGLLRFARNDELGSTSSHHALSSVGAHKFKQNE